MTVFAQKISCELQRLLLVSRSRFVGHFDSLSFDQSLQSSPSDLQRNSVATNFKGSSPGRRFVPQNERSLKRHRCCSVLRNEARRVVGDRATRRNRSTVGEGTCRSD